MGTSKTKMKAAPSGKVLHLPWPQHQPFSNPGVSGIRAEDQIPCQDPYPPGGQDSTPIPARQSGAGGSPPPTAAEPAPAAAGMGPRRTTLRTASKLGGLRWDRTGG